MGLHQRHTHGRVFRGEDAREQLKIRKRDSHGDSIILHVPEGFADKQVANEQSNPVAADDGGSADTAASVVYVTLAQTFEGPAMYSTLIGDYTPEATAAPTSVVDNSPNFYTGAPGSSASATQTTDDFAPAETSIQNAQKTAPTASSALPTVVGGTPIQATRAATATSAPSSDSQDSGLSGGAQAGLAIGIILAIGLACGLLFFCWRRKKRVTHPEALNEKHGSFADVGARTAEAHGTPDGMAGGMVAGAAGAAAGSAVAANRRDSSMSEKVPSSIRSSRTASTAPRLSLRPVTQFLPMLGDKNNGNANANANAGPTSDPFADASEQGRSGTPPSNPFEEQRRSNESLNGAVVAAGVAGTAAAHANGQKHSPKASWEGREPATPTNAAAGNVAAAPVAAGGPNGGSSRQPNNVHRVQLDFKPSMDDELELVSGALVRLLHEYDDGWALCISMDRSKQGVAPRTCLSKLPVKPRPQGPPPPQGHRPSPQGSPRGPPPGAGRSSNSPGPYGPPGAMQPRPLTPQSNRAPSPSEHGTPVQAAVSQAASQAPQRKPVPGMAM